MKYIVHALRILIGGLFIFSGLVKANDPMGLAYKMEEFFELWHTMWMVPFAKSLSITMNALEILSGVALWMGWQTKWNLRLLLALIVFFTGLTGYTYYTGFPKTCGCFGDCLPIDSSVSFFKDVALLVGILILLRKQQFIKPIFRNGTTSYITMASALFAFGMEYYVLHHLPIVDCLPYHVGQNIPEARMQPPPPPGSTVMFVYEKNGVEVEFAADDFPSDFNADTYRFIRRYETGEIQQPKIQGLVLFGSGGNDTTDVILNSDRVLLLFCEQVNEGPANWGKGWNNLLDWSSSKSIPLVLITNKPADWRTEWRKQYPAVQVVACDRTPIRTAARVDPTIYKLEKGVVMGKWAIQDFPRQEGSGNGKSLRSN